jgi:pimeloyl-ACP methyl ester carboxylesterase
MWRELDLPVSCITPDFPGFGQDTHVPDHVTIADFADHVAALIGEHGVPAVVCGLSLGGYVALALVDRHPQLVSGLLLANTRADADDERARAARDSGYDAIRIDGYDAWRNQSIPRLLRPEPAPQVLEHVWALAAEQRPQAVMSALMALRDRPDRMSQLGRIAVPTVVVAGEDDQVTPMSAIDALAAGIPGAEKRVIGEAGHLTAIEQPRAFAAILRELVRRVGESGT